MDLREHHATAQRHPWEVARQRFLVEALRRGGVLPQIATALDAGAGDAWFASRLLTELRPTSTITCWDAEYTPETMAQLADSLSPRLQFSATQPSTQHDLILLLDVLEHVEDDRAFLHHLITTCLRPGGWLLFTVPAWQPLFSRHDTWLHHFRRYAPDQAIARLRDAQLDVLEHGGLFHSLVLPRLVTLASERLRPPTQQHAPAIAWRHGRAVTTVVDTALRLDNAVSHAAARHRIPLPGLSFWALCQRPA